MFICLLSKLIPNISIRNANLKRFKCFFEEELFIKKPIKKISWARYLVNLPARIVNNFRVNALSAGVMKTLAMAGISGGKDMMKWSEKNSLMKRNITLDEVGNSGLYLLSDMSTGVTGETHYVDCGYNKVGVPKEI